MEILLAKTMGFCQGVKRAVGMAAESGAGSYVLGQLTHNPQVNKMVAEKGVQMTRSLYGLREGSRVVFRAHGEPPNSYLVAKSRLLEIVDATCPHVKNAQTAAQKLAKEDLCVIVIGDPLHPEVMSIKAWAGDKAVVVQNAAEVDKLPEEGRYGVISQTTCTDELFDELSALIAQKAAEHKIVRTICPATRERQASAVELAQSSDAVVVVGGRNSANTKKIKEIAEKHCKNTILVETAQELSKDMFLNTKIVGVTAGASTPDWIIEEVVKEMEDMGEMLEQNDDGKKMSLNAGDIVQGKVVGVGKDEVFVDINYKSEGIVPRAEIALNPPEDLNLAVSPGDVITVMTLDPDKDGIVLLSKVKADAQMALEKLNTIYENKETINVFVDAAVKGGVTCELSGLRGFIPASHLGLERVDDLSVFVGQSIPAQIIELNLDGPRKKIILSRRELLKQDRAAKETEFYAKIKAGEKYAGVVSRLTDFGAFIDLGGVDGLLHVSEMSWQKVNHPADILTVNDEIEVMVKKVDVENKKISLSRRELLEDPWLSGVSGLKEGQIVSGKVTQMTKFGAFVLLSDTVEGLVHISEIAEERIESPESVLKVGEEVKAKILKIDKKSKKVSLSIAKAKKEEGRLELKEFIGDNSEFKTSIGSKFNLNKIFND